MKKHLVDYICTTLFLWAIYTGALTPLAFLYWGMSADQWIRWWSSGIPYNLIINYPIGWLLIRVRRYWHHAE